jgi:acyl-coenzyme A thioesterase PaaI-like protein
MAEPSLQERYAPHSRCYGCGPANARGLHVGSHAAGDELVAEWTPARHHEAFDGVVNGGVLGTLLDCHSNWTAAHHLMQSRGLDRPPACVTSDYAVRLVRPTPSARPIHLRAWPVESRGDRVTVEAEVSADGRVTATCRGTFIAVRPGHPAYGRW